MLSCMNIVIFIIKIIIIIIIIIIKRIVPRWKNEWSYTSTPPIRFHVMVLS
jgi:hypothetical protein